MNLKLLIAGVLFPLWCAGVQPFAPRLADPVLEPWRWRQEEALDGLGVMCMDKASDGTLWFGGTGGIARYDGRSVQRFPLGEALTSSITHREEVPWVKALLCTGEGELLTLIGESLVWWSEDDWKVVIQDVGQSVFFNTLLRGQDGSYWLQVREGLWQVDQGFDEAALVLAASRKYRLMSACIDPEGDIWVVRQITDDEVRLIEIPVDDGRPRSEQQWFSCPVPFPNNSSLARIVAGADGLIRYVDGASYSALEAYDPRNKQWVESDSEFRAVGLYSLIKLPDGSIWAGGEGQVLRRSAGGNVALFSQLDLDLPLVPLTLFNFGDSRLWVAGRGGQVYSVDLGLDEWMTYAGLNFQCESKEGVQWFLSGSAQKVVSHNPKTGEWLQYGPEDGLVGEGFRVFASSHGLIWMTGRHEKRAALSIFDGKRWTRYLHPDFAEWIEPNAVFEASDRTVWLGAGGARLTLSGAGGALRYGVNDDGQVELINHFRQPPLPYYGISFAESKDGQMLIGSTAVHTYRVDDVSAPQLLGYPRDNTVNLAYDAAGDLWVAKEHAGIYQFRDGEWHTHSMEDGLASSLLSSLLVLGDGTVLAATDRGISRFDGTSWTMEAYSDEFGMSKRWSNMRESSDGSIWLSYSRNETKHAGHLISGVNVFRTTRHRPERNPPDTFITDYLKQVAQPGNSHVAWEGRDLWGDTPKELLQFSWRLNGGAWSAFSMETGKTFLDLDHGPHVLEVRARDRSFNIDPTPDRVDFYVVAPLWLQPWFITMVVLMVGGTGLLIWTMIYFHDKRLKDRQAHLVEMDRLKTSFFTNLSHELRTPLSVMLSPLESLLRSEANDARREKLSMVIRSAERVTALLTQLLDFRKLELGKMTMELAEGDVVGPVRSVVDMLQPMAEARRVSFRFEGPTAYSCVFDEDKLRKIASNLVANAIKYTRPGGEVFARLDFTGDKLMLVVEDNGTGIEPEHLEHIFDRFFRGSEKRAVDGSGIGLNLTKELVGLWGGTIRAESPIHEDAERPGTRFMVELPIEQSNE